MRGPLLIKPFVVDVVGWPGGATYYTTSCGKALAEAWRCDAFGGYTFGQFLKIACVYAGARSGRFGEPLTVNGKPAFYVEHNRAYIRIAYPGGDCVHNAHPLEVEPPEARRGTPYYVPELAA